MVIHQNLAHQRILYEGILKNITVKEATSQQLLFPLQLTFSKLDMELLKVFNSNWNILDLVFLLLRKIRSKLMAFLWL